MSTLDYDKLSKAEKAAAFLIMIGPEAAAEVMRHLDDAQIELVSREMANMPLVDAGLQRELLADFGQLVRNGAAAARGGTDLVQQTLSRVRGDQFASAMLERVAAGPAISGAQEIQQIDAREIVNLLKAETPQATAFVISCLTTGKAAEVIQLLPDEQRDEVTERLGSMEPAPVNVLERITQKLQDECKKRATQPTPVALGGAKRVADILKATAKEARKGLLARLEERNAELGAAVRKLLLSFEDLVRLSRADLQRVTREVDMNDLTRALKNAPPALLEAMLGSLSKRAAASLKEEIEMLGEVRAKDIEAAQEKIMAVVRPLEEAEEISFENGDENASR